MDQEMIQVVIGNRVKIIGHVNKNKVRYTSGGGCIMPREVCFHYGTKKIDSFFFENMNLVYQSVHLKNIDEEYLTEIYSFCAQIENITPEEFISRVTETYVMHEIGFANE